VNSDNPAAATTTLSGFYGRRMSNVISLPNNVILVRVCLFVQARPKNRTVFSKFGTSVYVEFKMIRMQKMNVIAKIGCYFERSVVTLKLRKNI